MQLKKFKITAPSCKGYMMVVYNEGNLKSILNEFNPPLSEKQLNSLLNYIPNSPDAIEAMFISKYGKKVTVEPVRTIGEEPEQDASPDFPANEKIALWCRFYAANVKDKLDKPVKYKTGPAESGKMKALPVTPEELEYLLETYFKSKEWYLKPWSISNFIKHYNEVRALAFAKVPAKTKDYPLPFDEVYFARLGFMEKQEYHKYLRDNGYKFEANPGRGGKWIKQHTN